ALRALALADIDRRTFLGTLLRAAFLHDLGKANSAFQAMVRKRARIQPFRHEVLSLWLLHTSDELRGWLFDGLPADAEPLVTAAVLCHHLKAGDLDGLLWPKSGSGLTAVECNWDHPDFVGTLMDFADAMQLPTLPRLPGERLMISTDPLSSLRRSLMRTA